MSDALIERIKRYHERTKQRYHDLGIIDGLILANRLLHESGDCEAASRMMQHAHALLDRLDAQVEADTLIERAKDRN